jgi:hypothetical protein
VTPRAAALVCFVLVLCAWLAVLAAVLQWLAP